MKECRGEHTEKYLVLKSLLIAYELGALGFIQHPSPLVI